MLETLLLLLIGAFIGWNIPEPTWAKAIKDSIIRYYHGVKKNDY